VVLKPAKEISADSLQSPHDEEAAYRKKKLKYRGKFRVQLWAICRVTWINMRRIAIYQAKKAEASA
jgi:hypothetical protein